VTLSVLGQKCGNPPNGLTQIVLVGQENDAKVIRGGPVKACPLDQQDFGFLQQFLDKQLIVLYRVNTPV
jgi:hypothetical protein